MIPILTEVAGEVRYGDVVEGVTMEERTDEVTGLSRRVVIDSRDPSAASSIDSPTEALAAASEE